MSYVYCGLWFFVDRRQGTEEKPRRNAAYSLAFIGPAFFSTHSELDPPTSLINQDIALYSLVPTGSPPPVTPGPGDLISSSSLYGYPHTPRTHTCKHLRAHVQTRLQKYIHTLIYTH